VKKEAAFWATVALLILSVPIAALLYLSPDLWVCVLLPLLIFVTIIAVLSISARSKD